MVVRRPARAAAALAAVALLALPPAGAGAAPVAGERLLFAQQGNGVVAVGLSSRSVGVPVRLEETLSGFGVSPDARTVWLTEFGGSIVPLDIATGTLGRRSGLSGCGRPVFSPGGRYAWFIEHCGPDDTRAVIDRKDLVTGGERRTAVGPDGSSDDPQELAVSSDGRTLYVSVLAGDEGALRLIDTATGALGARFPAPATDLLRLTTDGRTLLTVQDDRVTPVDLDRRRALPPVRVAGVSDIGIAPDGRTAWLGAGGALVPLDLGTWTLGPPLPVGDRVHGVSIAPGGTTAFVGTTDDSGPSGLVAVDLVERTVSAPLVDALSASIMPSQAPRAAFTVQPACAGRPTRLDAGASRAVNGRIARYAWRFGDGTSRTTTTSRTEHVYARAGDFRVTLTVTDLSGTSTERVFDGQQVLRNGGPAARRSSSVRVC